MQTKATIDSTGQTFTLRGGPWSSTYPIADLPKWLAFYRRQQELFPAHAHHYDDDVRALEKLAAQLRR